MGLRLLTRVAAGIAVVVAGVLTPALRPAPAVACSCVAASTAERLASAEVAFTGTVTARAPETDPQDPAARVTWTFAVDRSLAGTVPRTQLVDSGTSSAACGMTFRVGGRYLVMATRQGTSLVTGLCSGTRALSSAIPGAGPALRPRSTAAVAAVGALCRSRHGVWAASPGMMITAGGTATLRAGIVGPARRTTAALPREAYTAALIRRLAALDHALARNPSGIAGPADDADLALEILLRGSGAADCTAVVTPRGFRSLQARAMTVATAAQVALAGARGATAEATRSIGALDQAVRALRATAARTPTERQGRTAVAEAGAGAAAFLRRARSDASVIALARSLAATAAREAAILAAGPQSSP